MMTALASRGLKSAAELGADRQHGDRLKYMAGCRCDACRKANATYQRQRMAAQKAGDWNGIVPAEKARAHMLYLAKKGIGRRAIQAATDIGDTILFAIRRGTKTNIRARTERLILAVTVDAAGDRALVSAKPTWKLINKMLAWGYSKTELAKRLGRTTPALQINKITCTVKSAYEVEKLHKQILRERQAIKKSQQTAASLERLRTRKEAGKPLILRRSSFTAPAPSSTLAQWGGFR